jgi:hypothetical protein
MMTRTSTTPSSNQENTPQSTTESPAISIRTTRTCGSLSGSCTLQYQIGTNDQSEWFLRITQSTGNGVYNRDWYAFKDIAGELAKLPPRSMVVAKSLRELCAGKSSVTPGFVMAVMVNLGMLRAIAQLNASDAQDSETPASSKTQYTLGDLHEFDAAMAVLQQLPQGISVVEQEQLPAPAGPTPKGKGKRAAQ